MNTLSDGIGVVIPCFVKLVPIPNTTSALLKKWYTGALITPEPLPSASGCFSGNALFPAIVVITGTCVSSASSISSGVASAYITDATDESERTRWMGLLGASFAVGFTLGPLIGGLLGPLGYHVPLLVAAAMVAVNALFAAAVLREPETHASDESAPSGEALQYLWEVGRVAGGPDEGAWLTLSVSAPAEAGRAI